jgi:hypothetical protein
LDDCSEEGILLSVVSSILIVDYALVPPVRWALL